MSADVVSIAPIGYFRSPFTSKFGLPRQSGLIECLEGEVVFCPPYDNAEAVRGLDGFSHIWIIWGFSENRRVNDKSCNDGPVSLTVRPPRLGGNERVGVFATRSPFRPNGLGLSCVRLKSIEKGRLVVLGADIMNGTPVYDIKPYVPYADCHGAASAGFADRNEWKGMEVEFPTRLRDGFSDSDISTIVEALRQDPRPKYHNDSTRIYGMPYDGRDVRFRVESGKVKIVEIEDLRF